MPLATLQTGACTCHDGGTGHLKFDAFAVVGWRLGAAARCSRQRNAAALLQCKRRNIFVTLIRGN